MDAGMSASKSHYYPTALGNSWRHYLSRVTVAMDDSGNLLIFDVSENTPADDSDIARHAIWMGLLVNEPEHAPVVADGVSGAD